MKNAKTIIKKELNRLSEYSSEADIEIRILFEYITGKDYVLSMLNGYEFNPEQAERLKSMVDRLADGEPIQYILGTWSFMGNDFEVTPDVLIPRADTEILCECAVDYMAHIHDGIKVLDLCAGSGCIGVSIAKMIDGCNVDCADISENAVKIIERNALLNGVSHKVNAFCSDMFENCGAYDVIVSNPPYIPTNNIATLDKKVRCYEPVLALDGGHDGLDFYNIIANEAPEHLKQNGRLFLEIGAEQKDSVTELLKKHGFGDIVCKKDYGGNWRVISCTFEA